MSRAELFRKNSLQTVSLLRLGHAHCSLLIAHCLSLVLPGQGVRGSTSLVRLERDVKHRS